MKYTNLGTSGLKVSSIGLGGWQFGSKGWGYGREFHRNDVMAIIQRALDLGVNFIDTAEIYARGKSEEIIGAAIQEHRDEVVIATKFLPLTLRPSKIRKAVKNSLKRLQVDTIDLYQIHWPIPFVSKKRILHYMEEMVKAGIIRYIGVSNFSKKQLEKARTSLKSEEIVSNQVKYNMLQRGIEEDLLPYARKERISIIAYSPLAQGILTGKYRERGPKGGIRRTNRLFAPINLKRAWPVLDELAHAASTHKATSAQVAIAWAIRDPTVIAIPGAKSIEQLTSNVKAAELVLSQKELQQLETTLQAFNPAKIRSTLWAVYSVLFRW
ncbi:MAG: aldo/keto reductase [Candidatus Heimdallarchaeota archaeon]